MRVSVPFSSLSIAFCLLIFFLFAFGAFQAKHPFCNQFEIETQAHALQMQRKMERFEFVFQVSHGGQHEFGLRHHANQTRVGSVHWSECCTKRIKDRVPSKQKRWRSSGRRVDFWIFKVTIHTKERVISTSVLYLRTNSVCAVLADSTIRFLCQ